MPRARALLGLLTGIPAMKPISQDNPWGVVGNSRMVATAAGTVQS